MWLQNKLLFDHRKRNNTWYIIEAMSSLSFSLLDIRNTAQIFYVFFVVAGRRHQPTRNFTVITLEQLKSCFRYEEMNLRKRLNMEQPENRVRTGVTHARTCLLIEECRPLGYNNQFVLHREHITSPLDYRAQPVNAM
jgi:hypothetical protein